MNNDEQAYTVVGIHLDSGGDTDSFVEWVRAIGPESAVERAIEMDEARAEATFIAVFEGHHSDVGRIA